MRNVRYGNPDPHSRCRPPAASEANYSRDSQQNQGANSNREKQDEQIESNEDADENESEPVDQSHPSGRRNN